MKLIGIGLVFLGCTLYGIWLDEDQRKRIIELEQFVYVFELLKGEIDYRLSPLKEACLNAGKRSRYRQLEGMLTYFAQCLERKEDRSIEEMWQEALDTYKEKFHLKEEDYRLLYGFAGACGCLDKGMEKRNIEMVIEQVKEEVDKSKKIYERTSKLNKSLGVLVGLGISIFLL